jgi:thiol:disulfide interchange protein DsbD
MGAALGLTVSLPAIEALAIFGALGLGLALPVLLASLSPRLASVLPRPGPWMATFKTLMSFPMFATVVWLVWVLGQQVGLDGAAALLGLLVALAFAAWALGTPTLSSRARVAFSAVALATLGAALLWAAPSLRSDAVAAAHPAAGTQADAWQPWSAERVQAALAAGQPVFVDFTAAWCVTCQFNKRTTLADPAVRAAFADAKVLKLRADWTRRDAAITAELQRLGRSGVPVYVLHKPGGGAPHLFGEILSAGDLVGQLSTLDR